ncbi:MAG: dihydroneopterin aldolase, partial [Butyrivibrio sp.]|nr:dihydroneopterin aldolase [Butyrivibrio sp.]
MDRINLTGMEFYGYHGCLPEEREKGQRFYVDVEMFMDLSPAGKSDDLNDTVNYAEVFEYIRQVVEGPSKQLIESVAE